MTLQGTVIGSCHMEFNSPFFKLQRKTERYIKEDSVKPLSHIRRVRLDADFSFFPPPEVSDEHVLLSRYTVLR